MAYRNQAFCWHGIISTDVEKAKAFYSEVLGWKVQTAKMGDEDSTMFAAGGVPRAHLSGPQMPGVPSHWDNYLRVANVDASTTAAKANGGQVIVPPTDIPPGRFSVVASPSGALLSLFHEADEAGAQDAPAGPGAIHWTELNSGDLKADLAWLSAALGITAEAFPMPSGEYFILKGDGGQLGGAMQSPMPGSFWLSWVQVDDVDATLGRVQRLGGQALTGLMNVEGVGRMAVVQDSTGGAFGIITPPDRR